MEWIECVKVPEKKVHRYMYLKVPEEQVKVPGTMGRTNITGTASTEKKEKATKDLSSGKKANQSIKQLPKQKKRKRKKRKKKCRQKPPTVAV